jgi:hypothetical protein
VNTRAILPLVLVLFGCSSEDSSSTTPTGPCNKDPWQCPAGQTCWPKDPSGNFACLNSGGGKKGDECANTVGAPTCSDGLACFQAVGQATGRCVAYCDNAKAGRGCAPGESCATAQLSGTSSTFSICAGPAPTPDAGPDTMMTTDTGSDTGAAEVATDSGGD